MDKLAPDSYERFLSLYSVNQKRIFAFILTLVPRRVDAEDVLQQTAMDMWKLFDRFEAGSSFVTWGITIARYRVLKYRRKRQRAGLVSFLNDEAFQLVLENEAKYPDSSNLQLPALEGCIQRLNEHERLLLIQRYEDGQTYRNMAEKLNCSIQMVYKRMAIIHTNLLRCIRQTMMIWDS